MNDGNKFGNSFCEHPIVLIRELLKRQKKHVGMTNKRLFDMSQHMPVELFKLQNGPRTSPNLDLIEAATVLNLESHERYKRFQMRGLRDLDLGTVYDSVSCKTLVCVSSKSIS